MAFDKQRDKNETEMSNIKCYNCKNMIRCAYKCPDKKYSEGEDAKLHVITTPEVAHMDEYGEFEGLILSKQDTNITRG